MRSLAAIDVGSNTIRLLIGRVEDSKIIRLRCEMVITRLASGISETGMLKAENIEKSLNVLKEFSRYISEYNVRNIKAVGTSALREAKNTKEFLARVLRETGVEIEVISGNKEADLTAKGVLSDLPKKDSSLIIDIGGGSSEWIICGNSSPIGMGTIPAGVVKLFDHYVKSDPPSKSDVAALKKGLAAVLNRLKKEIGYFINSSTVLIGTAGTITTLASIDLELESYAYEKIQGHNIPLNRLYGIYERLITVPVAERKKITGLEPERADLIIPGILFTINIMELFGFNNILVSGNGLLEGALMELSERSA